MPINKERLLNIGMIALACLASYGLGHFGYAAGVRDANEHAEELAHIEAGDGRPSVFWSLAGLGVVFVMAALAWVLVARTMGRGGDDGDDDDNAPTVPPPHL